MVNLAVERNYFKLFDFPESVKETEFFPQAGLVLVKIGNYRKENLTNWKLVTSMVSGKPA